MFPGVPHVYHDGLKGGYLATKYLIQLGRRRVGFIASFWNPPCSAQELLGYASSNSSGCFSSIDRFRGYVKALEKAAIPYDPSLVVVTSYKHRNGTEAARELIGRFSGVNGVVAMTQAVANGCVAQFKSQGFSVPLDVSLSVRDSTAGLPETRKEN